MNHLQSTRLLCRNIVLNFASLFFRHIKNILCTSTVHRVAIVAHSVCAADGHRVRHPDHPVREHRHSDRVRPSDRREEIDCCIAYYVLHITLDHLLKIA